MRAVGRLRFTAAVAAKRRLPCAARPAVALRNSLRSLRSLRSNSRNESDDEARAAHAPTTGLRCSAPQRRYACRPPAPLRRTTWTLDERNAAPLRSHDRRRSATGESSLRTTPLVLRKAVGGWLAARLCGAEQRSRAVGARAARASSSDSSRLFERSERSERSEFRDATARRAAQGSRPAGPTAAVKRCKPPAHGFAALDRQGEARRALTPSALRRSTFHLRRLGLR